MLDPNDVRRYLDRDWAALEQETADFWRERARQLGPEELLRVADELRRAAKAMHPDWPTPEEREEDLRRHERVSRMLRSVRLD